MGHSRVLYVEANPLVKIFADVAPLEWDLLHAYAMEFVQALNSMPPENLDDLLHGDRSEQVAVDYDRSCLSSTVMKGIHWPPYTSEDSCELEEKSSESPIAVFSRMLHKRLSK